MARLGTEKVPHPWGWLRACVCPNELCLIVQNKLVYLGAWLAVIISLCWQVCKPDCTWMMPERGALPQGRRQTASAENQLLRTELIPRDLSIECSDLMHS
jgi:hypothetical protein